MTRVYQSILGNMGWYLYKENIKTSKYEHVTSSGECHEFYIKLVNSECNFSLWNSLGNAESSVKCLNNSNCKDIQTYSLSLFTPGTD